MPFDGNGNWSTTFSPIQDRDNNIPILASRFEQLYSSDFPQTWGNCVTRDGQGIMQTNFNFNNFQGKNLADGVIATDAVNLGQITGFIDNLPAGNVSNEDTIAFRDTEDDTNKKVTVEELTTFSLGKGFIQDTIVYDTNVNIIWSGECRDDANQFNIVDSDIDITLPAGAVADTTYHAFIGFDNDTDKNVIGEFDTDVTGANLVNITGAKRRVISIITNGSAEIIQFTTYLEKSGALKLRYSTLVLDRSGSTPTATPENVTLTVPNILVAPLIDVNLLRSSAGNVSCYISEFGESQQKLVGNVGSGSARQVTPVESLITSNSTLVIETTGTTNTYDIFTSGYTDERV